MKVVSLKRNSSESQSLKNSAQESAKTAGHGLHSGIDVRKAQKELNESRPHVFESGTYRFISAGDGLEKFKQFGHGVFFYFYSLRFFTAVFLLMSCICIVPLVFNSTGGGVAEFKYLPFWLRTTVVNCPLLFTLSSEPLAIVDPQQVQAAVVSTISFDYQSELAPIPTAYVFTPKYFKFLKANTFSKENGFSAMGGTYCSDPQSSVSADSSCSSTVLAGVRSEKGVLVGSFLETSNVTSSHVEQSRVVNGTITDSPEVFGSNIEQATIEKSTVSNIALNQTVVSESTATDSDIKLSKMVNATVVKSHVYASNVEHSDVLDCIAYSTKFDHSFLRGGVADSSSLTASDFNVTRISKAKIEESAGFGNRIFKSKVIKTMLNTTSLLFSQTRESNLTSFLGVNATISFSNAMNSSGIFYSRVEQSNLDSTRIQYSSISESTLINCIVLNSTLYGVTLENEVIYHNQRVDLTNIGLIDAKVAALVGGLVKPSPRPLPPGLVSGQMDPTDPANAGSDFNFNLADFNLDSFADDFTDMNMDMDSFDDAMNSDDFLATLSEELTDPNDPSANKEFADNIAVPSDNDFGESDGGDDEPSPAPKPVAAKPQDPNGGGDEEEVEDPWAGVTLYFDAVPFMDTPQEFEQKSEKYFEDITVDNNQMYFLANLIPDIGLCGCFFIAIVMFKFMMVDRIAEVEMETMSIEKFTVKISNLPDEGVTKDQVEKVIRNLTDAKIARIDVLYNFRGLLGPAKERRDLTEKLEELKKENLFSNETEVRSIEDKLAAINAKIEAELGTTEINFDHPEKQFIAKKAYVVFENCREPFNTYMKYKEVAKSKDKSKLVIGGSEVCVDFAADVKTINFQNFGQHRGYRFGKWVIFVVVIAALIVGMAYSAMKIEDAITKGVAEVKCPEEGSPARPKASAPYEVKFCYCDKNVNKILDKTYRKFCGDFLYTDASVYISPIIVVIVIGIFNMIIEAFVNYMFDWINFVDGSMEASIKIVVLFLLEFTNNLVGLLVSTDVDPKEVADPELAAMAVTLKLVNPDFYVKTGSKVIMLNFLGIFVPHIVAVIKMLATRAYNSYRAKRAKSQEEYMEWMELPEFEIDGYYVGILATMATALTFSSIMPILLPFAFASLIVTYWVHKQIFARFSARPAFYTDVLIRYTIALMPLVLIVHLVFSISVFGDWNIFTDEKGKEFWQNYLEKDESPTFTQDLRYRGLKNMALIMICAFLFLSLLAWEFIFRYVYYRRLVENRREELKLDQNFSDCKERLTYNSALGYDFRMLEDYKDLAEADQEEGQAAHGASAKRDSDGVRKFKNQKSELIEFMPNQTVNQEDEFKNIVIDN